MRSTATAGGAMLLTIHPLGNIMYGIYTAPDDQHKITHGGWVLAKKGVPNEKVEELLEKATAILNETNFSLIKINAADHLKSQDQSSRQKAEQSGNSVILDGIT